MRRLMVLVIGVMLLSAVAVATTIHVPADQPTIQAGIDAAADGDTVLVAAGVFKEDTLTISGRHLTIRGTFNPDTTFFDGRMVVDNSNIAIRTMAFTHLGALNESGGVFYGVSCDLDADSIVVRESKAKKGGALCIENGGRIMISHSHINGFVTCESPCTWGERIGGALFASARLFILTDSKVSGYANYEPRDGRAAGGALYLNCDTVAICGSDVSGFARAWVGGANIAEGGAIRCSAFTYRSTGNVLSGYTQADGEKVTPVSYAYGDARGGALFLDVRDGYISGDRYRQCHSAASYWTTPGHGGGAKALGGAIYTTGTGSVKMSNVVFDTTFVYVADGSDSLQIALGGAVYADCLTTVECGIFHSVTPDYVFGAQLIPCDTPSNRIWYVSAAGPLCSEDGSFYLPMHSIQVAVNGAVNGDTVIVLPGVYYEPEVNLSGKAIVLASQYIFNPDSNVVISTVLGDSITSNFGDIRLKCVSGEGANTVINGFTIQGNHGGISLFSSSPTISNIRFRCEKRAPGGGGGAGIFASNSRSVIDGCTFVCSTDGSGAGVYASGSVLKISRCEFLNCEALQEAAAVFLDDSAVIRGCVFRGNSSSGGSVIDCASIVMDSCVFEDNEAEYGFVVRSLGSADIRNSIFVNRNPVTEMGAVRCDRGSFQADSISGFWMGIDLQGWTGNASISSSIISENGYGVHTVGDTVNISHCVIKDNSASGLYAVSGEFVVDSCSLQGNGIGIDSYGAAGLQVYHSLFRANLRFAIKTVASSSPVKVANNTISGTTGGLSIEDMCIMENNVIVTGLIGFRLLTEFLVDTPVIKCNDIQSAVPFESQYSFYGDTTWGLNANGIPCDSLQNILRDPLFCDATIGNFHIRQSSPCAPSNSGCGVLIGALGVGCESGDTDSDGAITIADAVFLINYIFIGGPAPEPLSIGDTDCSGDINIADAVIIINYIFSGGPAPCAI